MKKLFTLLFIVLWLIPAYADNILTTTGQTDKLDLTSNGGSVFDILLDDATGNETAFTLNYETNKATSGNDTGLFINFTDTASPGASYVCDMQVGGSSVFNLAPNGVLNVGGSTAGIEINGAASGIRTQSTNKTLLLQNTTFTTASSTDVSIGGGTHNQTSGTNKIVAILPTYNQSSGTAANTDFLINRTETAVGSGNQFLIDAQVGGTSKFKVSNTGTIVTANSKFSIQSGSTPTISADNPNGTSIFFNQAQSNNSTNPVFVFDTGASRYLEGSSGNQVFFSLTPDYNQTATTGATDFLINRTETTIGSGAQYLINAQVGGVSKFNLSNSGLAVFDTGVAGSQATPAVSFGDGDSGFFETSDDTVGLSCGGNRVYNFSATAMFATDTDRWYLYNGADPSSTQPNLIPNRSDLDTGIGWTAADQLALVSGAKEMIRIVETGTATTDQVILSPGVVSGAAATPVLAFGDGDTGFYENLDDSIQVTNGGTANFIFSAGVFRALTNGPAILKEAPSGTNPTLVPDWQDFDSGLGSGAADQVSIIAGGVEVARASENTTDQFIISPDGIQNDATVPSLAFGDGDAGFFESADDTIAVSTGSASARFSFTGGFFQANATRGGRIYDGTPSATGPTFMFNGDTDTGIGGTTDSLSLISGGLEMLRLTETGTSSTDQLIIGPAGVIGSAGTPSLSWGDGDTGLYEISDDSLSFAIAGVQKWFVGATVLGAPSGAYPALLFEAASATNPTVVPAVNDLDTGIGSSAGNVVSIIGGGNEIISAAGNAGTGNKQTTINGANIRTITPVAAATYDTTANDYFLLVTYTGTGPVTSLTLMSADCQNGRILIIKDGGGNSTVNNITIDTEGAENIDGAATLVINADYGSRNLICYSSNWYIF